MSQLSVFSVTVEKVKRLAAVGLLMVLVPVLHSFPDEFFCFLCDHFWVMVVIFIVKVDINRLQSFPFVSIS